MAFRDRADAGRQLAERLQRYANRRDVLVLALPRGGVPVAFEVARALNAPLDVFLVRKLGLPGQEELAMGAIAGGGVRVLNRVVLSVLDVPVWQIERMAEIAEAELVRRADSYRGGREEPEVRGLTLILVDDGLATGSTMRAAAAALRERDAARIVVAVPVAARETCAEFSDQVDEIVCILTPEPFHSVGIWYDDFCQPTDEEVRELLLAAGATSSSGQSTYGASTGDSL